MTAKRARVMDPEKLAEALSTAGHNTSARGPVPLTALATGLSLLGTSAELLQAALEHFAKADTRLGDLRLFWQGAEESTPYLVGFLKPLTGWLDEPGEGDDEGVRRCFELLTTLDLEACLNSTHAGGELLGPVYVNLMSASFRKRNGVFYTPMSLSRMIAAMNDIKPGESVCDPCCGAGGMIIAAAMEMRDRGGHPELVHWTLNDIDPIAVALAGVNCMIRGLPWVTLACTNALTNPMLNPSAAPVEQPMITPQKRQRSKPAA